MIVTVLAGLLAAVAVAAGTTAQERTIAVVSDRVQTLMSVTLPFLGVVLVHAARPPARRRALVSSVLAALVFAVAVAVFGIALCVSVTAVAHFQLPAGQWDHVGTIVLGSLLVQIVAQLTGTGMGLLVRRPVI